MNWKLDRCQLALTGLWWIWGVLLILLLAVLSAQDALFGDKVGAAWQWFMPNLMPSMMLVGAAAYAKQKTTTVAETSIGPLFLIAMSISVVYLLLLTISVVGAIFSQPPLDWLTKSNYWLGPVQGLAASALGVFFAK